MLEQMLMPAGLALTLAGLWATVTARGTRSVSRW